MLGIHFILRFNSKNANFHIIQSQNFRMAKKKFQVEINDLKQTISKL